VPVLPFSFWRSFVGGRVKLAIGSLAAIMVVPSLIVPRALRNFSQGARQL